jgi:hypothetical protein
MTKIQATNEMIDQIDMDSLEKALAQKGKALKFSEQGVQAVQPPDPVLHKYISFIKSGLRMIGCGLGIAGMFVAGFIFLFVAEIIGIIEEMV